MKVLNLALKMWILRLWNTLEFKWFILWFISVLEIDIICNYLLETELNWNLLNWDLVKFEFGNLVDLNRNFENGKIWKYTYIYEMEMILWFWSIN